MNWSDVEEMLVKFRERSQMIAYMPKKLGNYELVIRALSDAKKVDFCNEYMNNGKVVGLTTQEKFTLFSFRKKDVLICTKKKRAWYFCLLCITITMLSRLLRSLKSFFFTTRSKEVSTKLIKDAQSLDFEWCSFTAFWIWVVWTLIYSIRCINSRSGIQEISSVP